MQNLLCPWQASQFMFYSTDPGIPTLLYYSYAPIMLLALFFTMFVFLKDKYSLRSRLLFFIALFFIGSTLNTIFEWTSNNPFEQMFSWQLTAIFELPISLISIYFIYAFINNKDNTKLKLSLIALFLPIIVLLPTEFNIKQFYLTDSDCGGALGGMWWYIYILELLSIFIIAYLSFNKYRSIPKENKLLRLETILFGVGSVVFLGLFNISNIFGEFTKTYEINLIGPIGLLLFIATLSYMIVKFKTFNIKLLGAQVLVWALVILIGSQFFYLDQTSDFSLIIITAFTLIIASVLGLVLVRVFKKEVALREQLEIANEGQKNLIHVMNHQIKGYLGKNKDIFAELLTDDYGNMPESAIPLLKTGLEETAAGVEYVTQILRGASADTGALIYDMHELDFKDLLSKTFNEKKGEAEKRGLKISLDIGNGNYNVYGDGKYLEEVFKNLIDNAITYTINGNVLVSLSEKYGKVIVSVKDTGIGVREEDKSRLFKEGGVTKDSIKVNIKSSGYGLVFVRGVVEAHKGRVWLESDGEGKGATFFVELPLKK